MIENVINCFGYAMFVLPETFRIKYERGNWVCTSNTSERQALAGDRHTGVAGVYTVNEITGIGEIIGDSAEGEENKPRPKL